MGGLSSDAMFVSWPALAAVGGGLGLLIQNIGLNYRQPVRRIFEIGPGVVPLPLFGAVSAAFCDGPNANALCALRAQPTYYITGRPEGQLQFNRIVGPQALTAEFYRAYGSACSPNVMSMSGKAGCTASGGNTPRMTWTMSGVVLDSIGTNVSGQEMIIQENLGAQFIGLSIDVS